MADITSTSELKRALLTLQATKEFATLKTALANASTAQLKETAILDLITMLGQSALGFVDPTA